MACGGGQSGTTRCSHPLALVNALAAGGGAGGERRRPRQCGSVDPAGAGPGGPDRRDAGAAPLLSARSTLFAGQGAVLDDFVDAACPRDRCTGVYREDRADHDYYRELYRGEEVRRIIRREHTSLPPAEERVALENDFKGGASSGSPQRADLHASPRGGHRHRRPLDRRADLLPRSTASYLQRVGRADRLTAKQWSSPLLPARPLELQHLADPLTSSADSTLPRSHRRREQTWVSPRRRPGSTTYSMGGLTGPIRAGGRSTALRRAVFRWASA
jgi:hypothetical protein